MYHDAFECGYFGGGEGRYGVLYVDGWFGVVLVGVGVGLVDGGFLVVLVCWIGRVAMFWWDDKGDVGYLCDCGIEGSDVRGEFLTGCCTGDGWQVDGGGGDGAGYLAHFSHGGHRGAEGSGDVTCGRWLWRGL